MLEIKFCSVSSNIRNANCVRFLHAVKVPFCVLKMLHFVFVEIVIWVLDWAAKL